MESSEFTYPIDITRQYASLKQGRDVLFSYRGVINEELIQQIFQMTEERVQEVEFLSKVQRKISLMVVEILQNIYHHLMDAHTDMNRMLFVLGRQEDAYYIITGNYLSAQKATYVDNKLQEVNALSANDLKNSYRELLSRGDDAQEQTGLALGILDICRKSGQQIEYTLKPVPENSYSYLMLKVQVKL